ncbi:MAG: GlxA family transcriptional regulator [Rhodospirillales bacterium]|jgi:AraC family transcriptional regulator, glycine betaine-responsive activator|nr:GlxA family transcriptional regulator [Rhodospirillales bacterium]MBT4040959.1 GlxA family transcriptional regulator [Rhodospirillales bacterium]MBT4625639.1 GlxA family transcriptional regulator [Rhodospirillales bacterium]MBT5350192.1 GlxA family transcriptional regulator [Rhodospirillales bacterium]MBT5522026.1 GlxA family transcriptional regulator [Rhodospirillales bacterium]
MFGDPATGGTQKIGFLLLGRFSMMALSSALEPLRMANTISEKPLYDWTILSVDGNPVQASNGMENLVSSNINSMQRLPMVVVCASYDPHLVAASNVRLWLHRQARHGAIIGSLDTGSYVLARAGLLDNYRATIHWEALDAFAEEFPHVDTVQDIFVVDRDRFSSAGATASLDMTLYLIRTQHGPDLARQVAEQFIYAGERDAHAQQRMSTAQRISLRNPKLGKAIAYMADNLEEQIATTIVANHVGLSVRALERLFGKWLKTTPARYHRQIRLERARALVQQTALPMLEIALRCGFGSAAHFSQAYSGYFGRPPSGDREYTRVSF